MIVGRLSLRNNCRVIESKVLFQGPITSLIVEWECLNCHTTYKQDIGKDLSQIHCLNECTNPMRPKNWTNYLGENLNRYELRAKKQFARTWVNALTDEDLVRNINYLLEMEKTEKFSRGDKRIFILLLTEDKKRSRKTICQP